MRKAMSKAINRPAIVEKRDGRRGGRHPASSCRGLPVRRDEEPEGRAVRSGRREEAAGRGRLSRRLRPHASTRRTTATSTTSKIAQAVAQMLSRVGIDTKVVAMPSSTFFTQATDLKFSFMLRRLEHGHRRSVVVAEGAADDLQPRQGLRHREPRPLFERQGGRADRGRARDRRRRPGARRCCSARPSSRSTTPASFRCTSRSTCGRRATASPTCRAPTSSRWRGSSSPATRAERDAKPGARQPRPMRRP